MTSIVFYAGIAAHGLLAFAGVAFSAALIVKRRRNAVLCLAGCSLFLLEALGLLLATWLTPPTRLNVNLPPAVAQQVLDEVARAQTRTFVATNAVSIVVDLAAIALLILAALTPPSQPRTTPSAPSFVPLGGTGPARPPADSRS